MWRSMQQNVSHQLCEPDDIQTIEGYTSFGAGVNGLLLQGL